MKKAAADSGLTRSELRRARKELFPTDIPASSWDAFRAEIARRESDPEYAAEQDRILNERLPKVR